MTSPDSRSDARRPGSFDEIRGYLAAAGDLSSIARARLLDGARSAARTEVERAGGAVGLAGAEEVARLRRTVERLERRVAALEAPGGTSGRPTSRPASRGAGRRPPAARPGTAPSSSAASGSSTGDEPTSSHEPPVTRRSASGTRPPVRRPGPAGAETSGGTDPGAATGTTQTPVPGEPG